MTEFTEDFIQSRLADYRFSPQRPKDGFRPASVLIPFYPVPSGLSLVLMKRPNDPGPHGGQISFPGGARDRADGDDLETALRETEEEIGVHRDRVTIWGRLNHQRTEASRYWISPFVGKIPYPCQFVPNEKEVERLLIVPFEHLLDTQHFSTENYPWRGGRYFSFIYRYRDDVIWGLTARILHHLISFLHTGFESDQTHSPI